MKRRSFLKTASVAGVMAGAMPAWGGPQHASHLVSSSKASPASSPENILLKDYRPKSIYKTPITEVPKAKFPAIDMHSHPYAKTSQEIAGENSRVDGAPDGSTEVGRVSFRVAVIGPPLWNWRRGLRRARAPLLL